MKCKDIVKIMEKLAPQNLAYAKDNVGLICGDAEQEIDSILLTLDVDCGVIAEAVNLGAQLIVSHHPIMYHPIQKITAQDLQGQKIRALIQNNISMFAAHTNLDIARGALCDLLAQKIGLSNVEILEYTVGDMEGIGRIGDIAPIRFSELAAHVKQTLGVKALRYSGEDRIVSRIAVNTGCGTGALPTAIAKNADVFITGDFMYDQARDTVASGTCVIDAGHYETENIAKELFYGFLIKELGDKVELHISKSNVNVYDVIL